MELEHQWVVMTELASYPICKVCGIVKRRDGKNRPCSGVTPRIVFKAQPPPEEKEWK